MGGQFNGHPWTANGNWAFKVDEPDHPLTKSFDGKGFWHTDEIYQDKPDTYVGEDKIRVLVSLDMTKAKNTDLLKNPKFDVRPMLQLIEDKFVDLQGKLRWGYEGPYMMTGMLNKHPRSAMAYMNGTSKEKTMLELYSAVIEADE